MFYKVFVFSFIISILSSSYAILPAEDIWKICHTQNKNHSKLPQIIQELTEIGCENSNEGSLARGLGAGLVLFNIQNLSISDDVIFLYIDETLTLPNLQKENIGFFQNLKGYLYKYGKGVEKNLVEAFDWYEKAAHLGDVIAMYNLAGMYENGEGIEKNPKKAFEWYKHAAKAGNVNAIIDVAKQYKAEKKIEKYIKWLEKAANTGNTAAMHKFAEMYEENKNLTKAFEWYEKAANAGNIFSINNLGYLFLHGEGIQQNLEKAFECFEKGTKLNHPSSMYNLGYLYDKGLGVKQDFNVALMWYEKAANAGNISAINSLARMYKEGRVVEQNFNIAFMWFKKSAEMNDAHAMNILGYMCANGEGVKQDFPEAVQWFKKAISRGSVSGMNNLAYMYKEGKGVTKDLQLAYKWYLMAAKNGDLEAGKFIYNLGEIYQQQGKLLDILIQHQKNPVLPDFKTPKNDLGVFKNLFDSNPLTSNFQETTETSSTSKEMHLEGYQKHIIHINFLIIGLENRTINAVWKPEVKESMNNFLNAVKNFIDHFKKIDCNIIPLTFDRPGMLVWCPEKIDPTYYGSCFLQIDIGENFYTSYGVRNVKNTKKITEILTNDNEQFWKDPYDDLIKKFEEIEKTSQYIYHHETKDKDLFSFCLQSFFIKNLCEKIKKKYLPLLHKEIKENIIIFNKKRKRQLDELLESKNPKKLYSALLDS